MPGSCNTGLSSLPSSGIGDSRPNGLDVSSMKARKPSEISPKTASTRAAKRCGRCRLKAASSTVQVARMAIHNNSEPSWAPHTAATR